MALSDKQIKFVESILYGGNREQLEKVEDYCQALIEFRQKREQSE